MKKLGAILLSAIIGFTVVAFGGCGSKENEGVSGEFKHVKQNLTENKDYNSELFYLNSLEFKAADPSVIYIDEGSESGYFYVYGTSDDIQCHGFQSWRSKDLTHWESMGIAFRPDFTSAWAASFYWAPEVIYDSDAKLYYMFYNAQSLDAPFHQQLSVAYSANPQGPFISPDNRRNADGKMLYLSEPVFDITSNNEAIEPSLLREQAIDASPFVDPITKKKYLYFCYFGNGQNSEVFGMEMKDWFTPIYSSLKQLTGLGYLTVEGKKQSDASQQISEGFINEAPFVYYEDGNYYLTFSVFDFRDDKYQVRQALGNGPLADFTKVPVEDGGAVIATSGMWDHITTAGHHSFIKCREELFIAYHTFYNRADVNDGRALAIDRVGFVENAKGQKLFHTNGPSYSLQALPEQISGYKNIATNAVITSNNTAEGSDVKYLNDNLVKYLDENSVQEYVAKPGTTDIELKFETPVTARAIMVYNGMLYNNSFAEIKNIQMTYLDAKGAKATVDTGKIEYDYEWNSDIPSEMMRPGGSAIVEFADLPITEIKITIVNPSKTEEMTLNEIVVLGKDVAVDGITEFKDYSYQNPEYPSSNINTTSKSFGTVDGLKTMYGYNLTHDDGTKDAYITQEGCYDQYAYFKDVYSTSYFIEAEFTVTEKKAYARDTHPKFGIAMSCPENTIFFYVNAVGLNGKDVGCAQRKLDNSDWNWNATQQNVSMPGVNYKDNNYVKLSVLREGKSFKFYVNGKLAINYDKFSVFLEDKNSAVGFLSFNTGMKIKNYVATQDKTIIDAKKIELDNNNKVE